MLPVRPYADRPLRLAGQVLADVFAVCWAALWIWIAAAAYRAVVALGTTGYRLQGAAEGVTGHLHEAGDVASRVPLAGDRLAAPLESAGRAAADVADASRGLGDAVTSAALPVAVAIAVTTVLPLVVPWALLRVRYARRAGATAHLAASPEGARLLALRALANAPARSLAGVAADPVAAWAREDDAVTAALADLELRRIGLRTAVLSGRREPGDR